VLDGLGSHVVANDPQLALVSAITNLEAGEVEVQNGFRDACDSWPVHSTAYLGRLRRLVEQLVRHLSDRPPPGAGSPGRVPCVVIPSGCGGDVPASTTVCRCGRPTGFALQIRVDGRLRCRPSWGTR
jgi:hypothetical protein